MAQLPRDNDSPFSLPHDVPEVMPIDYPELDSAADAHEVYDEGLDDVIGFSPYREDDDPIKSAKKLMRTSVSEREKYTTNHYVIRRWIEYRYGRPAHITNADGGLDKGGLYVHFEDEDPELEIEDISWKQFFKIFEKHRLAFLYKTRAHNGETSNFYRFIDRRDVGRTTEARPIA